MSNERQMPLIEEPLPLFDGIAQGAMVNEAPAESPTLSEKPEFIDNREVRLADALSAHLDWLHATHAAPVEMAIASGYFNPGGFAMIAERIERLAGVRLLLGAEPPAPPAIPLRMPGEPRGLKFIARIVNRELARNEDGLKQDRDLLPFGPETDHAIRRLLEFLRSGKIEVRRYEKSFLHGKAFLFAGDEGVISGSSNFTAAGLTSNLELNLGRYDAAPVAQVHQWFDALWAEAEPYDLGAIYQARLELYDPYLVFLRVLWERYGNELIEENGKNERIPLTTFQNDGILRARRILERHNGVLIADGVGLGKTFIAGELLRHEIEDERRRALLIAPATLRDGTWARFLSKHQLGFECVSFEQLTAHFRQDSKQKGLDHKPKEYSLIVIDEAQAFRNPATERAQALRELLKGSPPKKLVLMSATPVNNSLWDLFYLFKFFVRNDAEFSDRGIRSLREKFVEAVRLDPDQLSPDALFDILDATTVRRTRRFVRDYYPNDRIKDAHDNETIIQFPTPHVEKADYSLDDALPGFFERIKEALAPEQDASPQLTLARYSPTAYQSEGKAEAREIAMIGLLRSALLKRFESSAYAFAATTEKMARAHDTFLEGLVKGYILTAPGIAEWEQTDNDEALAELIRESGSQSIEGFDIKALKADVTADRDRLMSFAKTANRLQAKDDPKLKQLVEELAAIERKAKREAIGDQDYRNKRKVIVFSYFADTVTWIAEYLRKECETDQRLAAYRGRIVAVAGNESVDGVTRQRAVFGFAPESSEAPPGHDQDKFDILITTDVLAEGVNLQQARNIINYDLPWNPMRLVQRHGRIDRIGSPHRDVYIRCFFPERQLDELLALELRIRRKIAQAAASIGIEHEVIPGAATGEHVFAEAKGEIERLRQADASIFENAGADAESHSGEEYRQELRKGLERYGKQIEELPWGAGSGLVGNRRGHFFCAKVGEQVFLRFVLADGGGIISDTLNCLKLIACKEGTPKSISAQMVEAAFGAWQSARHDIFQQWKIATDPANLQPRIAPSLRQAAEHVKKYPPPEMTQVEIDRLVESIEAPWEARIERDLRECMREATGIAASSKLAARVKDLGLTPYQPASPNPPIEENEVRLICWIALDKEK